MPMNDAHFKKTVGNFLTENKELAKKYKGKVSIEVEGREVVLADERENKEKSINNSIIETAPLVSDNLQPVVPDNKSTDDSQVLTALEDITKTNITQIQTHTEEIKKLTEMIDSTLNNNEEYREITQKAKEITKERLTIKQKLLKDQSVSKISQELKDLKSERRELQNAQSDYLREYLRLSGGATQLELFDGSVMDIITVHKLIRKK